MRGKGVVRNVWATIRKRKELSEEGGAQIVEVI